MRIQSVEQASTGCGIGTGISGALSVVGDLSWGTISTGTEKNITITDDGSGDLGNGAACWTGDSGWLYMVKVDGDVVDNGSGPNGEWVMGVDPDPYFAMSKGGTKTLTFLPVYTDNTEKTGTLEIKRGAVTVDETISADATVEDAFLGAALSAGAMAIYTARDVAEGAVAASGVLFEDISGNEEPDIVREGDRSGSSHDIISTGFSAVSISKSYRMISGALSTGGGGNTNLAAAVESALSGSYKSGLLLFRINDGVGAPATTWGMTFQPFVSLWMMDGHVGNNPSPTTKEAVAGLDTNNDTMGIVRQNSSFRGTAQSTLISGAGAAGDGPSSSPGDFVTFAFSWNAANDRVKTWLSTVGNAFGDLGAEDDAQIPNHGPGIRLYNKLSSTSGGSGMGGVEYELVAVVPITGTDKDSLLEDLHNAIA